LFGQAATVWEENPSDVEQWHWWRGLTCTWLMG